MHVDCIIVCMENDVFIAPLLMGKQELSIPPIWSAWLLESLRLENVPVPNVQRMPRQCGGKASWDNYCVMLVRWPRKAKSLPNRFLLLKITNKINNKDVSFVF
jgi:hypothetical protein